MDERTTKLIARGLWAAALALVLWVIASYTLSGPSQDVVLEPMGTIAAAQALPALDLNQATLEELDELPGIGPVLAQRILDAREENGPFASREDVLAVPGIGQATYEAIEPFITY